MYRKGLITFGLILTGLGAIAACSFYTGPLRVLPPELESAIVFAPILLAVGCVTFVRGLPWGAGIDFRLSILLMGLLMLAGCLLLCASFMTGGWNEGTGMLGAMILTFVGFPGFVLTLIGLVSTLMKHK